MNSSVEPSNTPKILAVIGAKHFPSKAFNYYLPPRVFIPSYGTGKVCFNGFGSMTKSYQGPLTAITVSIKLNQD
jgi:hypothetical protein